MLSKKSELGQFNTTRKEYILSGMEKFIKGKIWVDPYAGNGDLLEWAKINEAMHVNGYDVDPKKTSIKKNIKEQDTLLNPPDYSGCYIIANPPYLAKNKCKNKDLYNQHQLDDLYKIAIKTTISCNGGIFIVPLNFLSSEQAGGIRKLFFKNFDIIKCKVFEESVFDDTDYTVCAFYYERCKNQRKNTNIDVEFWSEQKLSERLNFQISEKYEWILGEEFYKWLNGSTTKGINRWTVENVGQEGERHHRYRDQNNIPVNDFCKSKSKKEKNDEIQRFIFKVKNGKSSVVKFADGVNSEDAKNTLEQKGFKVISGGKPTKIQYYKPEVEENIILIEAIDTGTKEGMIGLKDIREEVKLLPVSHRPVLAGLPTSRNKAHVKFDNPPSKEDQIRIINYVNKKINLYREKYHSIFLTSFRNSTKECSRKRIGFDIVYRMINKAIKDLNIK